METTTSNAGVFQLILLVFVLIPAILFLLTQFNTLKLIHPDKRTIQPGLVWLQLIPAVGQLWQFIVVTRVASSIRNQWQAADEDSILGIDADAVDGNADGKPTLGMGITYCILNVIIILFNLFSSHAEPTVGGLIGLASVVCWIVYWVQLAGWKRKLKQKLQLGL